MGSLNIEKMARDYIPCCAFKKFRCRYLMWEANKLLIRKYF